MLHRSSECQSLICGLATLTPCSVFAALCQWLSRPGRIPIGSCQARARRRPGLIRVLVRSNIESSLRWLQTGCLRLSETPVGRSLRLLASRAANNRAARRQPALEGVPLACGSLSLRTTALTRSACWPLLPQLPGFSFVLPALTVHHSPEWCIYPRSWCRHCERRFARSRRVHRSLHR